MYPLLERGTSAKSDADMAHALREFLAAIDSPRIMYDFGADRSLCQYVIDGFDVPDPKGRYHFASSCAYMTNSEQTLKGGGLVIEIKR